jgi:hypothetical protein
MAGMFPTSFAGGVSGAISVPYSYVQQLTTQPAIRYYSNATVTLTQAQMNSILGEFACVFDHAGWAYQPGAPCNLWGALNKAFGAGGAGLEAGAVVSVNGKPGPNPVLSILDIAGAAPLNDANLTGTPTAPTQELGDTSNAIATDAFVNEAITEAFANLTNLAVATQTIIGVVRFANAAEQAAGTAGLAIDAAALKAAILTALTAGVPVAVPVTHSFVLTSVGQTVSFTTVIGAWTALFVNGLRQTPDNYTVSGTTVTLAAGVANVGDTCLFEYTPS